MPDQRDVQIEKKIDKEITGGVAIYHASPNAFSIAPTSLTEMMEFAKLMAVAGECIPKAFRDKPGACLAIALQAFRTGADPFAVANKAYLVNDRIAYEAQYIHAVVNTSGMLRRRLRPAYTGDGAKRRCVIIGEIVGETEPFEYESPEFGNIPVKNSPLWKNDPDQQFFYYASRAWARRYLPEVILGMDTGGDLEERGQMKDITPPPRPTREALQDPTPAETNETGAKTAGDLIEADDGEADDGAESSSEVNPGPSGGGGSPAPTYEITEGDGEVFDTDLDEVENHLLEVFHTAQLNGPKAIEATIENNEPTIELIRKDGHHELANRLSIEIAQMRRLLQPEIVPDAFVKPKRRRATKAEMAERRAGQQQQQNPADGPQAQSPAVVSPQTAALSPGASPAPSPEIASPTASARPNDTQIAQMTASPAASARPDYTLPMVTENGKPALYKWAHARLLVELRKAKSAEEIARIQGDNHEHIEAFKGTLSPLGWAQFKAEMDALAKAMR